MESNAKVKLRGVQVGRVAAINGGTEAESCLEAGDRSPTRSQYIPANVEAADPGHHGVRREIRRPRLPAIPEPPAASAAQVLQSRNVSTEVNTVFENVVGVLNQIDTAKLNAVLSALAEGVRGQGERIGEATTDANQVLLATQPAQRHHPRRLAGAQGLQRHL